MRFHYDVFTITTLDAWIELHQPDTLELSDHQYFIISGMVGKNIRKYRGIPIVFLGTPQAV
jgi:hypothetical protein